MGAVFCIQKFLKAKPWLTNPQGKSPVPRADYSLQCPWQASLLRARYSGNRTLYRDNTDVEGKHPCLNPPSCKAAKFL